LDDISFERMVAASIRLSHEILVCKAECDPMASLGSQHQDAPAQAKARLMPEP